MILKLAILFFAAIPLAIFIYGAAVLIRPIIAPNWRKTPPIPRTQRPRHVWSLQKRQQYRNSPEYRARLNAAPTIGSIRRQSHKGHQPRTPLNRATSAPGAE